MSTHTGDLITWAGCGVYQATVLLERGALAEALAIGTNMIKTGREASFDTALRWGHTYTGATLLRLGELSQAQQLLEDSLQRSLAVGDYIDATHAWGELGLCLCARGKTDLAAEQLERAALLLHQHKVPSFSPVFIFLGLAQVELTRFESNHSRHSAKAAMMHCHAALTIARSFHFGLVQALRMMGTLHWLNGHQPQAERSWQESLQVSQKISARYEEALTHMERGNRLGLSEEEALGRQMLAECQAGTAVALDKPG
jgi:tetratricopeptide (TPR) repeat protein